MKILLVTPDYLPKSSTGGARVATTLAEELAKKNHEVTVIAGYYPVNRYDKINEDEINKVKVVWIPFLHLLLENKIPQLIPSLPPTINSLPLLKNLEYEKFDIVHLFAFPSHLLVDIIALFANTKNKLLTIHAFPKYASEDGPAPFFLKIIYKVYLKTIAKLIANSCKIITTISKFTAKEAIKYGISPNKIRIIPNGINLNYYFPRNVEKINKLFGLESDDILVLSIGRITWHKRFEDGLLAIQQLIKSGMRRIKYIIAGEIFDKNYYYFLKKEAIRLGISDKVIFPGYIDEETKIGLLSRCNIYLATSSHEGFGLTLLEAMALGKPIVATNIEGHKDVVNKNVALLVKPKNPHQIAHSLKEIINNPSLSRRLSQNSLTFVKKFSWENIVKKYEYTYKEVLER